MQDFQAEFLESAADADAHAFLLAHPRATFCHHPGWASALRDCYGKRMRYFAMRKKDGGLAGVAPVVELSSLVFGRQWVCLPYLDYGGPLASDSAAEKALVEALAQAAGARGVRLEIRSAHPLSGFAAPANEKVAMLLSLQGLGEEAYWKKLDARVRNQVRKAEKSGITLRWGSDQLRDFYAVFQVNMRNLGSPVHSDRLFSALLAHIPGVEIGTAWRQGRCIGGLVRIRFRDTLAIPWASTLAEERIYCPNHALYYDSIKTAFREGLKVVDFGRSTEGEGTYRFKSQWLAESAPLPWYPFARDGSPVASVTNVQSGALSWAGKVWAKMPLPLANRLGPRLRPMIAA
jgi:FemAB-related protein (PEP-CTERM system-associated)